MSRAAYALQRSQSVPIHRGRVRTWRLWCRCRARLLLVLLEGCWQ